MEKFPLSDTFKLHKVYITRGFSKSTIGSVARAECRGCGWSTLGIEHDVKQLGLNHEKKKSGKEK